MSSSSVDGKQTEKDSSSFAAHVHSKIPVPAQDGLMSKMDVASRSKHRDANHQPSSNREKRLLPFDNGSPHSPPGMMARGGVQEAKLNSFRSVLKPPSSLDDSSANISPSVQGQKKPPRTAKLPNALVASPQKPRAPAAGARHNQSPRIPMQESKTHLQASHSAVPMAADPKAARRDSDPKSCTFSLTDEQLQQRYRFFHEIGYGEWGSIWDAQPLKELGHLPSSAFKTTKLAKLNGKGYITIDNTKNFRPLAIKMCNRERKAVAWARTERLWNEFKAVRSMMDCRQEQTSVDSDYQGQDDDGFSGWHPSIVQFYEFIVTPSFAMIVMPKYEEPMCVGLSNQRCRPFFQQLLSGVYWMHQKNVCHNDIKVANMLVSYEDGIHGFPVLVDFGFATIHDPSKQDAFKTSLSWGTPEYLAPERARGDLHDERVSDIWSLGVTFFEIATTRTPFESFEEQFTSRELMKEYYNRTARGKWIGTWDIPHDLEDLIHRMIIPDPVDRIGGAEALLHSYFDPVVNSVNNSLEDLLGSIATNTQEAKRVSLDVYSDQDEDDGRSSDDQAERLPPPCLSKMAMREQQREQSFRKTGQKLDKRLDIKTPLMSASPTFAQVDTESSRVDDDIVRATPLRKQKSPSRRIYKKTSGLEHNAYWGSVDSDYDPENQSLLEENAATPSPTTTTKQPNSNPNARFVNAASQNTHNLLDEEGGSVGTTSRLAMDLHRDGFAFQSKGNVVDQKVIGGRPDPHSKKPVHQADLLIAKENQHQLHDNGHTVDNKGASFTFPPRKETGNVVANLAKRFEGAGPSPKDTSFRTSFDISSKTHIADSSVSTVSPVRPIPTFKAIQTPSDNMDVRQSVATPLFSEPDGWERQDHGTRQGQATPAPALTRNSEADVGQEIATREDQLTSADVSLEIHSCSSSDASLVAPRVNSLTPNRNEGKQAKSHRPISASFGIKTPEPFRSSFKTSNLSGFKPKPPPASEGRMISKKGAKKLGSQHHRRNKSDITGSAEVMQQLQKMGAIAEMLAKMIDDTRSTLLDESEQMSEVSEDNDVRPASPTPSELINCLKSLHHLVKKKTLKQEEEEDESCNNELVSKHYSIDLEVKASDFQQPLSQEEPRQQQQQHQQQQQLQLQKRKKLQASGKEDVKIPLEPIAESPRKVDGNVGKFEEDFSYRSSGRRRESWNRAQSTINSGALNETNLWKRDSTKVEKETSLLQCTSHEKAAKAPFGQHFKFPGPERPVSMSNRQQPEEQKEKNLKGYQDQPPHGSLKRTRSLASIFVPPRSLSFTYFLSRSNRGEEELLQEPPHQSAGHQAPAAASKFSTIRSYQSLGVGQESLSPSSSALSMTETFFPSPPLTVPTPSVPTYPSTSRDPKPETKKPRAIKLFSKTKSPLPLSKKPNPNRPTANPSVRSPLQPPSSSYTTPFSAKGNNANHSGHNSSWSLWKLFKSGSL